MKMNRSNTKSRFYLGHLKIGGMGLYLTSQLQLMAATEARRLAHGPHLPVGCAGQHGFLPALLWLATMASVARAMCRLRLLAQDVGQGRGCTSSMVRFQASISGNLQNPTVFRISFSPMKSAIFGVRIWYFHTSRPMKPHHFCKNRRNQSLWNPI